MTRLIFKEVVEKSSESEEDKVTKDDASPDVTNDAGVDEAADARPDEIAKEVFLPVISVVARMVLTVPEACRDSKSWCPSSPRKYCLYISYYHKLL